MTVEHGCAPSPRPAQTSRRLLEEERGGTRVRGHVQPPSAKDQGSARSFFRSSKLCLRTALI